MTYRACIVVFGREPVPGRTKTRLASAIGNEAAASVQGILLRHTLDEMQRTGLPVVLSLAESPRPGWAPPGGVPTTIQPRGDLGVRMRTAFDRNFAAGYEQVVLVGSDIPALGAGHITAALERLDAPVVLGPATDGGYYLVAQRAPGVDLFSGIPWSAATTLAETRGRLAAMGIRYRELEPLADVDVEQDLLDALEDPGLAAELVRELKAVV